MRDEMLSIVTNSKVKVQELNKSRGEQTRDFKNQVSQNQFKIKMRKIIGNCRNVWETKREIHDKKVIWLNQSMGE